MPSYLVGHIPIAALGIWLINGDEWISNIQGNRRNEIAINSTILELMLKIFLVELKFKRSEMQGRGNKGKNQRNGAKDAS